MSVKCSGRTLFTVKDGRFVWIRCRERGCHDVQAAREQGAGDLVFHVLDIVTGAKWTEVTPGNPAKRVE